MAHYDIPKKDAEGFQSEAKLEAAFIKQLVSQGYEYATHAKEPAYSVGATERCTVE